MPCPPLAERFERLEEALRICRQMGDPDNNGPFEGRYYQLAETLCVPPPVSAPHPEIMIGSGGERKTLRLVARYADACNLFATSPEEVAHKPDVLRAHCDETDRDHDTIRRTITYSGSAATREDLDAFTHDVEPYGKLGIDTVIISPHLDATSRWMETFAAPAVRRLAELG
ncbi:LLM class F420-dependent oxidoreductase [Streptomyces resistomycificus]|nr:LLM class F420-dependent oxidoreductase [Streptomyces resistomycificus]